MLQMENVWKRNLTLIWIAEVLCFIGYGAALPFIPFFMQEVLGVDETYAKVVAVPAFHICSTVSIAIVSPLWGIVADRFGRKIMLLRAFFVNALLMPAMVFSPNLWVLLVLRTMASMFSGTKSASKTLIAATTPKEHQGFALGVLSTAYWTGMMGGYFVGSMVVYHFGYTIAFICCGVSYFIGGIITLFTKEDFVPPPPGSKKRKIFDLSGLSPSVNILLVVILLTSIVRSLDAASITFKVQNLTGIGEGKKWVGYLSMFAAAGGVIAGFTLGKLADKVRTVPLMVPVLLASGIFVAWQGAAHSMIMLCAARFLTFCVAGGVEPILYAKLSRVVDPEKRGSVFGLSVTAMMAGSALGSAGNGILTKLAEVNGVFYITGLCYLVMIPVVYITMTSVNRAAPHSVVNK